MTTLEADSPEGTSYDGFPPPVTNERLLEPSQIETAHILLIIGTAARTVYPDIVRNNWPERFVVNDKHLHILANEAIKDIAMTGMEHHLARQPIRDSKIPYLKAYDFIFEASPHKDHSTFISDLSMVIQFTDNILAANTPDPSDPEVEVFCPTDEQLNFYKQMQNGFREIADIYFEALFLDVSQVQSSSPSAGHCPSLDQLDPVILELYLEREYTRSQLARARMHAIFTGDARLRTFGLWKLDQLRLVQKRLRLERPTNVPTDD